MIRKITAILLAALLAAAVLAGCTNGPSKTTLKIKSGETVKLMDETLYNKLGEDATVVWTSSDEKVVKVEDGKVTYVSEGTATVTAEGTSANGKKTASLVFEIICLSSEDDAIKLDKYFVCLENVGDAAVISPTLGNVSDKIVSWKSSDENIATVEDGMVTYVSAGRAEITVSTEMGYSAVCRVLCDSVVMTLGDVEITDAMYGYWVASYKTQVVEYSIGYDDESIWTTVMDDDQTFGEMFDDTVYSSVSQIIEAVHFYKEKFGGIPDLAKEAAVTQVASAREGNGGAENFAKTLSVFYANEELLEKVFIFEEVTNMAYDAFFGDDGTDKVTDEEIKEKFFDKYVHISHILFDLNYVVDEESGEYSRLSEKQIEEKTALAEEVWDKITKGEITYDEAMREYSDDSSDNYDGYVFTEGEFAEDFTNAAFTMKAGDTAKVDTAYGIHIMRKYELTEDDLDDTIKSEIKESIESERFTAALTVYADLIEADKEAVTSRYDVVTTPLFSDYT